MSCDRRCFEEGIISFGDEECKTCQGRDGGAQDNPWLNGLARQCHKCGIIDHYKVKGKKPVEVVCKCGNRFTVQKYKRGERPKAKEVRHEPGLKIPSWGEQ